MTEKINEELSALVDDESSDFGLRKVIGELNNNSALTKKWDRYHIAKSAIQRTQIADGDLSQRITAAIAYEPVHKHSFAHKHKAIGGTASNRAPEAENDRKVIPAFLHAWAKPLSSAALAASVTLALVLSWQEFKPTNSPSRDNFIVQNSESGFKERSTHPGTRSAVVAQTVSTQSAGFQQNVVSNRNVREVFPDNSVTYRASKQSLPTQRFQVYMISHANHVAVTGGGATMPFVRVISAGKK